MIVTRLKRSHSRAIGKPKYAVEHREGKAGEETHLAVGYAEIGLHGLGEHHEHARSIQAEV
jgi:hypothetical protein